MHSLQNEFIQIDLKWPSASIGNLEFKAVDGTQFYFDSLEPFYLVEIPEQNEHRILNCSHLAGSIKKTLHSLEFQWIDSDLGLQIHSRLTLKEAVLFIDNFLVNRGEKQILIRDAIPLFACTRSRIQGQESKSQDLKELQQLALSNDYWSQKPVDRPNAVPLFLDEKMFVGIDWVASEILHQENRILCRYPAMKVLTPGEKLNIPSCSLGVGIGTNAFEAFHLHLNRLRNRKHRISFYFDWLTHGSEGPNDKELGLTVNLISALKSHFNIHFDVVSSDDGLVETHQNYARSYLPCRDDKFPAGIHPYTEKLKSIGVDFGIWLGPDGYGDSPEEEQRRIKEVVDMVRLWNVRLIKLDTVVSMPYLPDPYHNNHKFEQLHRLVNACRKARNDMIFINHRLSFSPYVLLTLDSLLWGSREAYPDHLLTNNDKPRPFSRLACFSRPAPENFGFHQPLLEDHGVCFNGETNGWKKEFIIHAFARGLDISPEIYGTLFMLQDEDFRELSSLMDLHQELLVYRKRFEWHREKSLFIHKSADGACLCIINDDWKKRKISLDFSLLSAIDSNSSHQIKTRFPFAEKNGAILSPNEVLNVELGPFAVLLLESSPLKQSPPTATNADTKELPVFFRDSVILFEPRETRQTSKDCIRLEAIRFQISNDPMEWQCIQKLPQSSITEVQQARGYFVEKLIQSNVVSQNAWDGDKNTCWKLCQDYFSDLPYRIHRLDLGAPQNIDRLEIWIHPPDSYLTDFSKTHSSSEIFAEASHDLVDWKRVSLHPVIRKHQLSSSKYLECLFAEFAGLGQIRYIRLYGIDWGIQEFRAVTNSNYLPSSLWKANYLLTSRPMNALYTSGFKVPANAAGDYLTVVVNLPEEVKVPFNQESFFCWLEAEEDKWYPIESGSPPLPFHGWVSNPWIHSWTSGNSFVQRYQLTPELCGKFLQVKVAWIGPSFDVNQTGIDKLSKLNKLSQLRPESISLLLLPKEVASN